MPVIYSFLDDLAVEFQKIPEKLVPNLISLVVQLIALILLILLVMKVAYKPVKEYMNKRKNYIEETINKTNENNAISERNMKQSEEAILASKKQASEIILNAEQLVKNRHEELIKSTEKEIERMKKDADEDIRRSKEEALEDIHKEMVSIALDASKEILKREVNEKDNTRLVEDFIKDNN